MFCFYDCKYSDFTYAIQKWIRTDSAAKYQPSKNSACSALGLRVCYLRYGRQEVIKEESSKVEKSSEHQKLLCRPRKPQTKLS